MIRGNKKSYTCFFFFWDGSLDFLQRWVRRNRIVSFSAYEITLNERSEPMSPTAHSRLSNAAVPNLKREDAAWIRAYISGGKDPAQLEAQWSSFPQTFGSCTHHKTGERPMFTSVYPCCPTASSSFARQYEAIDQFESWGCFLSQVLYTGERIESPPPRLVLPLDGLYKGSTHTHSRNQRVGESDLRRMERKKKKKGKAGTKYIYRRKAKKALYQPVSMHKSCPK